MLALRPHCLPLKFGGGVGANESRRDAVDCYAEGSQLVGQLTDQAYLSRLGRGVGLDAREAHAQAGAAGNDEDSSCAGLLHARRNGLRADESPLEIHVEDGLPLVQGNGLQRLARLSDGAAGAVDENVHPAAACGGLLDQGRHRFCVGNVGD